MRQPPRLMPLPVRLFGQLFSLVLTVFLCLVAGKSKMHGSYHWLTERGTFFLSLAPLPLSGAMAHVMPACSARRLARRSHPGRHLDAVDPR